MNIKEKRKINEIIESLSLESDVKKSIIEYLTNMSEAGIDLNDNFVFRIPRNIKNENFHLYNLIDFSSDKKANATWEIIAPAQEDNLELVQQRLGKIQEYTTRLQKGVGINKRKFDESEILEQINDLNKKIEYCNQEIKNLNAENINLKEILYNDSSAFDSKMKIQTIPIDIYIDTDDSKIIFGVYSSVLDFLKTIRFEKAFEFNAVKGSWIKKILAKSLDAITSEEVVDRLKEIEYGVEVNTILKQQSEIDKNQSEALSNIIGSLKDIPNAAIRIGALIVVKLTDSEGSVSLQTRTLSIKELHLLNKKPELLQMPKQILQALAKEIEENEPPQISEN